MRQACFSAEGLPLVIPPHGFAEFHVNIKARIAGPVKSQFVLYTDCRDQPEVAVKLSGHVDGEERQRARGPGGSQAGQDSTSCSRSPSRPIATLLWQVSP